MLDKLLKSSLVWSIVIGVAIFSVIKNHRKSVEAKEAVMNGHSGRYHNHFLIDGVDCVSISGTRSAVMSCDWEEEPKG